VQLRLVIDHIWHKICCWEKSRAHRSRCSFSYYV